MAVFAWDESFATGSAAVDQQHRELFRQVDSLSEAMKRGKGRGEMAAILDFLGQYVMRHFADEEREMDRVHCPAAAANRQAHRDLIAKFGQFRKRFDAEGAGPALVLQIHETLCNWLVQHIKAIDLQLRDCVESARPGLVGAKG